MTSAPRWPRRWPVAVISLPAAVATWSGWVGLGEMAAFGKVKLLPGLWDDLQLNTAITLPIGVEAYAAFAISAALTSAPVAKQTRRFAWISSVCALGLGMGAQVAYHLLKNAGLTAAPWQITTFVSCLPVLVLGLGAVLAHMLHRDRTAAASPAAVVETPVAVSDLEEIQPAAVVPQQAPIPDTSDSVSGPSETPAVEAPGDASAGVNLRHPERVLSEVSDAGQKEHGLDHSIRAARADGMTVREIVAAFHPVKKWRVEEALKSDSRSDTSDTALDVSGIPQDAADESTEVPAVVAWALGQAGERRVEEPVRHTDNGRTPVEATGDPS